LNQVQIGAVDLRQSLALGPLAAAAQKRPMAQLQRCV